MWLLKIFIVISLIFYLSTNISNATGIIVGKVYDTTTKQVAVGVSVSLDDGNAVIKTDRLGNFKFINLKNKYYSLTFESLGCKKLIVDSVLVTPDSLPLEWGTYYLEDNDKEIKVIEVVGKREYLKLGRIPNIHIVYVLVLNSKDSTILAGINLSLSDGTRATTNDSSMYLFYVDKKEKNPIKFSHNGYKFTDELDFSKRIDTFYIPYPMLIEDTVFSFSGFALLKKDSLPVSNAIMTLWGIGTWHSKTNLEGFFNLDNLPPGNYQLAWSFKTTIIQWNQGNIDKITIDSTNIIDTFYLNEIRGQ